VKQEAIDFAKALNKKSKQSYHSHYFHQVWEKRNEGFKENSYVVLIKNPDEHLKKDRFIFLKQKFEQDYIVQSSKRLSNKVDLPKKN